MLLRCKFTLNDGYCLHQIIGYGLHLTSVSGWNNQHINTHGTATARPESIS